VPRYHMTKRVGDLGEVDEVSILPLVERLTPEGSGLKGEPGVSYLVRAGGRQVLFDSGLSGGKPESALAHNAQVLGVPLGDLDAVVISHLHADHVGALAAMRRRTFVLWLVALVSDVVKHHVHRLVDQDLALNPGQVTPPARPRVHRPACELPGGRSGQVAPREHDAAAHDQGEGDGEDGQRADCPEPVLQGLVAEQQVER
jgi:glyoxylase-like metal-dependent hydrolase (beta-lactamase superfamily II)